MEATVGAPAASILTEAAIPPAITPSAPLATAEPDAAATAEELLEESQAISEPEPPPPGWGDGAAPPPPVRHDIDWERTLGVRLPVWGGAIMLLIAGFFLVNWALESGASLLTPTVRVALCALAAFGLLGAAYVVKARRIANGERIASALATAAIAVAYGTMFLAASIFHLVPGVIALAGAVLVTVAAIVIATQFGQRVMLVGLLGGYLSPFFVWSVGTSSGMIPTYVTVLLTASVFAIRWNGWWGQVVPAVIAPALWALGLVFSTDPVALAVFYLLLALAPAIVALAPLRDDASAWQDRVRLVTLGVYVAAVCLALGTIVHQFHLVFLAAMTGLGLGGGLLIARYGASFRAAWFATLSAGLVVQLAWREPDGVAFLGFAALFAVTHLGALVIQFRAGADPARRSFELAGLSALLFVILLVKLDGWMGARDVPYLWAAIAFVISAGFGWLALRTHKAAREPDPAAGFAVGCSALLSLGLGLVLDPGLYALAAAVQAFGLSLLYLKFRVPAIKAMHIAYVCLYGLLLLSGQAASSGSGTYLLLLSPGGFADFVPTVGIEQAPITLLLLPGLLLLGAATAFARVAYSRAPQILDVVSIVLLALAIHFLILPTIPSDLFTEVFVVGSWWFNAMALLALVSIYAASKTGRTHLFQAGAGLAGLVALAMLAFAVVPIFRFWPTIETPGWPVFNVALTAMGLPTALLLAIAYLARQAGSPQLARGLAAFGGLTGLLTLLVLIRQSIHGTTLNGEGLVPGQIELYSYSGSMLVYGFALLWGGVVFSSVALRGASLLVVLATIAKVFLYDVSGLEGLWRVGSFLGLGVALLAVSWFYGRYVFGIGPSGAKVVETPASAEPQVP
ncbi:MAG: putative integral rane protein [Devosia sp.]|nr:putative integral rane protein [Devosia sp.]